MVWQKLADKIAANFGFFPGGKFPLRFKVVKE
jgi:hypothetical protein